MERVRSTRDRRNHELALTGAGREVMATMRDIGRAHEREVTSALSAEERDQLGALLVRVADSLGLDPEVHPGYRAEAG